MHFLIVSFKGGKWKKGEKKKRVLAGMDYGVVATSGLVMMKHG